MAGNDSTGSGWRAIHPDDYLGWAAELAEGRLDEGREKYGPLFRGDPLHHLAEELVDALYYCFAAEQRHQRRCTVSRHDLEVDVFGPDGDGADFEPIRVVSLQSYYQAGRLAGFTGYNRDTGEQVNFRADRISRIVCESHPDNLMPPPADQTADDYGLWRWKEDTAGEWVYCNSEGRAVGAVSRVIYPEDDNRGAEFEARIRERDHLKLCAVRPTLHEAQRVVEDLHTVNDPPEGEEAHTGEPGRPGDELKEAVAPLVKLFEQIAEAVKESDLADRLKNIPRP